MLWQTDAVEEAVVDVAVVVAVPAISAASAVVVKSVGVVAGV